MSQFQLVICYSFLAVCRAHSPSLFLDVKSFFFQSSRLFPSLREISNIVLMEIYREMFCKKDCTYFKHSGDLLRVANWIMLKPFSSSFWIIWSRRPWDFARLSNSRRASGLYWTARKIVSISEIMSLVLNRKLSLLNIPFRFELTEAVEDWLEGWGPPWQTPPPPFADTRPEVSPPSWRWWQAGRDCRKSPRICQIDQSYDYRRLVWPQLFWTSFRWDCFCHLWSAQQPSPRYFLGLSLTRRYVLVFIMIMIPLITSIIFFDMISSPPSTGLSNPLSLLVFSPCQTLSSNTALSLSATCSALNVFTLYSSLPFYHRTGQAELSGSPSTPSHIYSQKIQTILHQNRLWIKMINVGWFTELYPIKIIFNREIISKFALVICMSKSPVVKLHCKPTSRSPQATPFQLDFSE